MRVVAGAGDVVFKTRLSAGYSGQVCLRAPVFFSPFFHLTLLSAAIPHPHHTPTQTQPATEIRSSVEWQKRPEGGRKEKREIKKNRKLFAFDGTCRDK